MLNELCHPHSRGYGSTVHTAETMMTFREFFAASIDDSDPRCARSARVNAYPVGLIVATGGVAVTRLVDGPAIAIMLLAVVVTAVCVAAMLGVSYALFRRGESEK